ncbi:MAG: heparin lyase I family protein [Flavobacteriaceae bacterium]|nr:heparin lyase I family protein [Flavobacteriaceae bacterium]
MIRTTTLNKQKIINNLIKFLLLIFSFTFFFITASAQIIFDSGFENGVSDWSDSGVWKQVPANAVSSTDSREGVKSVRFLPISDNKRSEFTIRNGKGHFGWGEEFWVGFSIYLVEHPTGYRIISQHHSTPHLLPDGSGSADWSCTAGPNSFIVLAKDDNFLIRTSTNSNNVNTVPPVGSASWGLQEVSRPYQLNQWYDFVLHYKYTLDNTGFMKVWLNGDIIADKQDTPTVYKYDLCGEPRAPRQYQKIGMYYGTGNQGGEILYDAFRIGKENSSYDDVAPGGGTLTTDEFQNIDIRIFPNPIKNNKIHIQLSETILINTIRIYDILGKEVFTKNIQSSKNNILLKPNLSEGVYIMKLNTSEKGSISKKIIIE